jgi:putative oxidoreductase
MAFWMASVIIALTLLSGYHKILNPDDFAMTVFRYHLLPGFLVNLAALYIPWLEMTCGLCLLFIPKYRVSALWIALMLILVFTLAIAINLLRDTAFGCGCFNPSPLDQPMTWLNVSRNIGLLLLSILALVAQRRALAGSPALPQRALPQRRGQKKAPVQFAQELNKMG